MKKVWRTLTTIGALGAVGLLYTNTVSSSDPCSQDAVCREILRGIAEARKEGLGMTDAQLVEHMASRLGYGLNPIEPRFQPDKASGVHVREMAYHLARQIQHSRGDSAQIKGAIAEVAPLASKTVDQIGKERIVALQRLSDARAKLDRDIAAGKIVERDEEFCVLNTADVYCKRLAQIRSLQKAVQDFSTSQAVLSQRRADLLRYALGSQSINTAGGVRDVQINLEGVLQEFWLNHFNIDYNKSGTFAFGVNGYANAIRGRMRTDFKSLLTTVITHPGMIHYLDNQTNSYNASQRAANNQNLGRELLELHTLGIGPRAEGPTASSPYTQDDVEAAAAILTGNTYVSRMEGDRYVIRGVFNKLAHIPARLKVGTQTIDIPAPKVMGKVYAHSLTKGSGADVSALPSSYNGQLMALLGDLAAHNRTRGAICLKLVRRFVSGVARMEVRQACRQAYGSTGDLKAVYRSILTHKNFWSVNNFRRQIKNPVEVAVSIARLQGVNLADLKLAPTVSPSGNTRSFATHLTLQLEGMTSALGLSLRGYAFPTGYAMMGGKWLSKGFLTQSVVHGFRASNLYEGYSKAVASRIATKANESVYAGLSARKDRDAFMHAKAFRRPSSVGITGKESLTMFSISKDAAKRDNYRYLGNTQASEMRTAMELAQSSRFAIIK